ncbi:MAG: carbohydrate ABC transporter permease [Vallitalea sp.]|nr:carbohydrate ABC transporter permease [Vallitalea sp.]
MNSNKKLINYISNGLQNLVKLLIVVIMAFPFYWMVVTSLKTIQETKVFPPTLWPKIIQWENYAQVWKSIPFGLYTKNSLIVSLSVLILQFLVIIPAAYAFARYKFKGKNVLFGIVLMGFMIPQQVTFIPIYMMFSKLKLFSTYIPLVAPFIANAFGIFLLRQYFMKVPEEIIEAARLDDAGELKIIWRIMMPMAKPAIVTIGLLSFIATWNSYFWPLVMTTRDEFRTLPIGVTMMSGLEGETMWNFVMGANVILIAPVLIIYLLASKQIRKAFVYSGIK